MNIVYFFAGLAALYYGADFLVKGGVDIAKRLGISSLVIGLTLVACATSAPELAVSLSSALQGNSDIAMGNAVGSNIANIGLILGVCACILPLNVDKQLLKLDAPLMVLSAILLTVLYFTSGGLNRIHGAVLLAIIIIYNIYIIRKSRKNSETETEKTPCRYPLYLAIIIVIASLGVLVGGAKIFLLSAVYFAKMLNLSDAVIGLTVVAVGTSLPELATSVVAACKGEKDIAIGNVVGSNIFNILSILGVTALIKPMNNSSLSGVDFGMMTGISGALLVMLFTGRKLSRIEGAILLLAYIIYTIYLCR